MELAKLIGRRAVQLLVVLIVVSFFTFLLVRLLPGDPTDAIIPFGTQQQKQQLREDLGLDEGFFQQYWDYVSGLAQGDLGHQYSSGRPVSDLVEQSLPVSLQLDDLRADHRAALRDPVRDLRRVPSGHEERPRRSTRPGSRSSRVPSFVLALLLSYFDRRPAEVVTHVGLRARVARSALRPQPHARPRRALPLHAPAGDHARRRARSRCTCASCAAT